MWKGFSHRVFGFAAAGMVVAALFFFLSPQAETLVGVERVGIVRVVVVALFAAYGIRLLARLIGMFRREQ